MPNTPYSANIAAQNRTRWTILFLLVAFAGLHFWRRDNRQVSHAASKRPVSSVLGSPVLARTVSTKTVTSKQQTHQAKIVAQDKAMTAGLNGQLIRESLPPSPLLQNRRVTAWIYLPPNYSTSQTRYPVAYLLHGAPGEPRDFFVNAKVQRVAEQLISSGKASPMILVAFDGFGPKGINDVQNYLDRADGSFAMESFITKTLVPWVDARYRTISSARARALVGFSAGGYGAANLSFKHPDIWKVSASIAGFFDPTDDVKHMTNLLGPKSKKWDDNSPLLYVRHLPKGVRLHFYFDCGRDDSLFHEFLKMEHELKERGADFKAQALAGDHAWDYVHDRLFDALKFCDLRWKELETPKGGAH